MSPEFDNTPRICGAGLACEAACPIMQTGRVCPTLDVYFEESGSSLAA